MQLKLTGAILLASLIGNANADEGTDERIINLQNMLKQQQQQMQAQQLQLQAMAEELKNLQHTKVDAQSKTKANPVYVNLKDGVSFGDASNDWKLTMNGRVQGDARAFNPDETAADTVSVRRARLGATMTLYNDYSARVEGEYSGSNTLLTYAYVDINPFKQAKIRIGQFKPSYGLERSMSSNFTDFQERSLADALLGSTFDRGIMMHGSPFKGVYYSLAYLNGNNGDEANATADEKDVMGHVTTNIAEVADWQDTIVHVGGFYAHGKQEENSATPIIQTEARGYKLFETSGASANKFADAVDRTRGGIELALAKGSVKVQSEYILADFEGHDFNGNDFDRHLSAWYASVNWLVTGESFSESYKDGVFGRLKPFHNFKVGTPGWGALQLGLRYSNFDGGDFVMANTPGTGQLAANKTNQADAWTFGANWILNPNTRFMANYIHTHFDHPVSVRSETLDDEDAITMRAQFDF